MAADGKGTLAGLAVERRASAENFLSIIKRGVIGTYHHWSQAHIQRYLP